MALLRKSYKVAVLVAFTCSFVLSAPENYDSTRAQTVIPFEYHLLGLRGIAEKCESGCFLVAPGLCSCGTEAYGRELRPLEQLPGPPSHSRIECQPGCYAALPDWGW